MIEKKMKGFSLIEVLVAVVIFTIGLLGAGALVLSSVRNTNNSHLRTHANLAIDAIAERMRANPRGVGIGAYNATFNATAPAITTPPYTTVTQIANRDLRFVGQQLAQALPNGSGTVLCVINSGVGDYTNKDRGFPPIDGQCTVTISWTEVRDVDAAGFGGTQSFQLVVQP